VLDAELERPRRHAARGAPGENRRLHAALPQHLDAEASTEWKPFSSSIPRVPYQSVPSVSTPSTSRIMRRMRRARSSASEAA